MWRAARLNGAYRLSEKLSIAINSSDIRKFSISPAVFAELFQHSVLPFQRLDDFLLLVELNLQLLKLLMQSGILLKSIIFVHFQQLVHANRDLNFFLEFNFDWICIVLAGTEVRQVCYIQLVCVDLLMRKKSEYSWLGFRVRKPT